MVLLIDYTNEACKNAGFKVLWRTGGAKNADATFLMANDIDDVELLLPSQHHRGHFTEHWEDPLDDFDAVASVVDLHPAYDKIKHNDTMLRLHARNYQIVAGPKSNRAFVDAVLCWTPDGYDGLGKRTRESGGTGQGIAIAASLDIPVFNLKQPLDDLLFEDFVDHWIQQNQTVSSINT